jgi:hypothetical protein
VNGTGGSKTNQLPVTTTTAITLFEIQANKGSASDRETANAEALYAPQKGVESPIEVKSQNRSQCSIACRRTLAPLRMGVHSDNWDLGGKVLLLSYRFGNHQ